FSEWELTVASWHRDKRRFGMRGFDETYPDHKRVMMEIMGRKPQNPITLGLMQKVRTNYYRLTDLGRSEAHRMRAGEDRTGKSKPSVHDNYEAISRMIAHPAYQSWREDFDEPRRWNDVLDFLGAKSTDDAAERMQTLSELVQSTISTLHKQNV